MSSEKIRVVAFCAPAIAKVIREGGYGKTYSFLYFGKKKAPSRRVATLHPPVGNRPTLTDDYWVGYDPFAGDDSPPTGGFRCFRFDAMEDIAPINEHYAPQ